MQRIINALQEELLVEPMGPAGGFRLGPALGHLINKTQCDIISHTRPLLVELSDQLGETVCLCRRSYDQVQIIERIVAERELRVVVPIGAHGPAVQTASGQVLLALEAPECVEALVGDMNVEWRARLGAIRAQGWASGFDEVVPGISSCAMAVDTYLGMFAIAVVAPTVRARDHQDAFRAALQACKRGIERAIGRQAEQRITPAQGRGCPLRLAHRPFHQLADDGTYQQYAAERHWHGHRVHLQHRFQVTRAEPRFSAVITQVITAAISQTCKRRTHRGQGAGEAWEVSWRTATA